MLRREVELLEFYPRSTTMNQVAEVVRGWDPRRRRKCRRSPDLATCGAAGCDQRSGGRAEGLSGNRNGGGPVAGLEPGGGGPDGVGLLNEIALGHVTGDGVCIGSVGSPARAS